MLSRTQIIQQLSELTNFRFVAYLDKVSDGKHRVRLLIPEFKAKGLSDGICVQDFTVTEENGYLSAINTKLNLKFDRLT